jgi:hypothetical protein
LVLVHENPDQLKLWLKQISCFLNEKLALQLHPKKTILQSVYRGINFVGYIVKPRHTLIRRKITGNLKKKLWRFNRLPIPENETIFAERLQKILAVINSYYGQFKHADTFNLRRSIYYRHFSALRSYLEPADLNFYFFKIKILTKAAWKSRY